MYMYIKKKKSKRNEMKFLGVLSKWNGRNVFDTCFVVVHPSRWSPPFLLNFHSSFTSVNVISNCLLVGYFFPFDPVIIII